MEDLALFNPDVWLPALAGIAGSPLFWALFAITVLYIIFNSKAIVAWISRKK